MEGLISITFIHTSLKEQYSVKVSAIERKWNWVFFYNIGIPQIVTMLGNPDNVNKFVRLPKRARSIANMS